MLGPDPNNPHPLPAHHRVCFLKPVVKNPNIQIGAYTYYDDPDDPQAFEARNVLYHYDFIGDRLIIGKFCALATEATFIMNGANHDLSGFSTFPFEIFGQGWEAGAPSYKDSNRGDTVVGSDVWIGYQATVMPGVKIGHGAIVASRSVVTGDVAPYSIVAGNPARAIRRRFTDDIIVSLLEVAWWDWPVEKISRNLAVIRNGDIEALLNAA